MSTDYFHVINDPIHGAMQFTLEEIAWLKPFIDHPSFQRLRHIKQLGMADLIFPGAVHTRFNHSLGCCYVANQIATKLGVSLPDKQLVTIAALLHDIGHGPLSHAFEETFNHVKIHHEDWTPYFIQEFFDEDFLYQYNKENKAFPLCEEKLSLNQKLIMHQRNDKRLLSDIISSQLDADRLDYLLRDSHFCGVSYGEFDYRWLLHCLTVIDDEGLSRLGITYKGIGVVENYLIARRLMIRNIYYHYKKYAAEFLMKELLSRVTDEMSKNEHIQSLPIIQFLKSVRVLEEKAGDQQETSSLKKHFIEENYSLYKQLCDYDIHFLIRELANLSKNDATVKIAKRLQRRQLPLVVTVDTELFSMVQQRIQEILDDHSQSVNPWQLTILNPRHHSYLSRDEIKIEDEYGRIRNIDENSIVINALLDKKETTCFLCVDKEITDNESVKHLLKDLIRGSRAREKIT